MPRAVNPSMKTFLYAVAGFAIASTLIWSALLAWAAVFVRAGDSYWDRTPYAADIFFACWLLFCIGAAMMAARIARRP